MLQLVNVPLQNGTWIDLWNNNIQYNSSNYSLYNFAIELGLHPALEDVAEEEGICVQVNTPVPL